MASQWYIQSCGRQSGPVSFRELVEMVRSDRLAEGDMVRADYMVDWLRADAVVGLFYLARRPSSFDQHDFCQFDEWEVVKPEITPPASDVAEPEASSAMPHVGEFRSITDEAPAEPRGLPDLADALQDAAADFDTRAARRRMRPSQASWFRAWTFLLRRSLWASLARSGAVALAAILAGACVLDWSAREALRFPGLLGENVRLFPLWGECRPAEYWAFIVDLMFLAGALTYFGIRWVETNLEEA